MKNNHMSAQFSFRTQRSFASVKRLLAVTVSLTLLLSAFSQQPAQADDDTSTLRQGLPGRRISGGVRLPGSTSCFADFNQSVVAILPRTDVATTAESHPTFWFSIPEFSGAKSVNFELFDDDDELIYSTQIAMGNEHGLSEFKLPETVPGLKFDEDYRWVFSVACDVEQAPSVGVEWIVRRVEISDGLAARLAGARPEERLELYTEAQLWHEQVNELINLRRRNLSNLTFQVEWTSLIDSVGLSSVVSSNISDSMIALEPASLAVQYLRRHP